MAWLPRYRIEVGVAASSDEDAVWEVWLCGLDGSLCVGRPEARRERLGRVASCEAPTGPEVLVAAPLLEPAEATERARELLARSAHVLRLRSGTADSAVQVESWRHPAHLEITRRLGRWGVRAYDAVSGRRVSRTQLRALLDLLVDADRPPPGG